MMTRKDYDRIAEVLAGRLRYAKNGSFEKNDSFEVFLALCAVQDDLTNLFKFDNPNFDAQRFNKLILDKVYP